MKICLRTHRRPPRSCFFLSLISLSLFLSIYIFPSFVRIKWRIAARVCRSVSPKYIVCDSCSSHDILCIFYLLYIYVCESEVIVLGSPKMHQLNNSLGGLLVVTPLGPPISGEVTVAGWPTRGSVRDRTRDIFSWKASTITAP